MIINTLLWLFNATGCDVEATTCEELAKISLYSTLLKHKWKTHKEAAEGPESA